MKHFHWKLSLVEFFQHLPDPRVRRALAHEIKEAEVDDVLALKGHHETVPEEVTTFLDAAVQERNFPRLRAANSTQRPRGWPATRRSRKIMAGSKSATPASAPNWPGSPTATAGRACKPSAWSNPSAGSAL